MLRMDRRTLLRLVSASPLLSTGLLPTKSSANPASGLADAAKRRVRPGDPDWPGTSACSELLRNLRNPFFIGEQPWATQISGWADAWISAPSVFAVAAKTAADVAAAVNFAREHNLRLVVKGAGHSLLGTSNAADS